MGTHDVGRGVGDGEREPQIVDQVLDAWRGLAAARDGGQARHSPSYPLNDAGPQVWDDSAVCSVATADPACTKEGENSTRRA